MTGLMAACATTPPSPSSVAPAPSTPPATAPASVGATATPQSSSQVGAAITASGIQARLDALARVSTRDDGYRALGSRGYDAAAELVAAELRAAGWQVTEDVFTTDAFVDEGGSELTVDARTFGAADILPLIFAPAGDVTGPVVAIDWDAPVATGRGCQVADYGDLPDGAIVLVRSGQCFRRDQVLAAQQAGAAGFVAGYPTTGSGQPLRPTLIEPAGLTIPAVSATGPAGDALAAAAAAGGTARLVTHVSTAPAETRSVIGELTGSTSDRVVMVGAHLDSVVDGPGINDNGSGVAALLEIAKALGETRPGATIRLAFWAAEEVGLLGSSRYVGALSDADRADMVAYLNADMVASPNGFAGVYADARAPTGSAAIHDLLVPAVGRHGMTAVDVVEGGSDHIPFANAGIAIGGVFSGASDPLTADQASVSGSTVGLPADPCYHQACDDGSNVDTELGRVLAGALADVALVVADDPMLPPR